MLTHLDITIALPNTGRLPTKSLRNNESAPTHSPELSARPPASPRQLSKTAHLSWKDNSSNEAGFRIYRITGNQKIKIAELAR